MSDQWAPLSLRGTVAEAAFRDTLYEGVPEHLDSSLRAWANRNIGTDMAVILRMARQLRWPITAPFATASQRLEMILRDPDQLLDAVDWLLADIQIRSTGGHELSGRLGPTARAVQHDPNEVREMQACARLLAEAGSVWRVSTEGRWRLERRVDPTIAAAATALVTSGSSAGQEIAQAWAQAFGRTPNPDEAYRHAVLAVEAVACAVFTPRDPKPSLGKAIAHLSSKESAYTVADLDSTEMWSGTTLLAMLRTLWTGHRRHAAPGGIPPLPMDAERAQTAVTLAVTLVHWFQTGLIRARA